MKVILTILALSIALGACASPRRVRANYIASEYIHDWKHGEPGSP